MKKCTFCGALVTDNETKCPKCGAELGAGTADPFSGISSGLDHTSEYDPADIQETKVVNIIAYLSILFFLPLVVYPNSKVGRFHANQALLMFIILAILSTVTSVIWAFAEIPVIGVLFGITASVLGSITGLIFLAAFIFELVNILDDKVVELPLIGRIRLIK